MDDYRDEHSADIALLLTLAQIVREMAPPDGIKLLDAALKPFERYPDPVETHDRDV